jgi:hypothetical protein
MRNSLRRIALSFGKAFLATFIAGIGGIAAVPDWSTRKAALAALTVGALDAGFKSVQIALEK